MKIIKKIMRFTLQHNFLWQCSNQFQLLHTFRKKTQFKFALARLSAQKIERSPMHWTCKIQGAQHIICIKKLRFSSHPRANVRHQEPLGSTRTQPWLQKKKTLHTSFGPEIEPCPSTRVTCKENRKLLISKMQVHFEGKNNWRRTSCQL